MQTVTELALDNAPRGVFTRGEAGCWSNAEGARLDGLLKRAVAHGEVWRLRRELYVLHPRYLRRTVEPFALAQRIHGPSYVSMESALAWHGAIPEAVYTITSVTQARSRTFDTTLGVFSFTRVPQKVLYRDVTRHDADDGAFFIAQPLKALTDYIYAHDCRWTTLEEAIESLRLDEETLRGTTQATIDGLLSNYAAGHVQKFLQALRREFKP